MKRNCFLHCRLECLIPVVVLLCTLSVARPLSAAGSGVRGQVLALDEQGKLTGIVAGATIELTNQAGQVAGRATSDAQGAYKIDIAPGSYLYKVQAAGFRDENVGRGVQLKLTEGYSVYNFSLTKGKNDPNQQPPAPAVVPVGKLEGRVLERTGDGKLVGIPAATVSLRGGGSRALLTAVTGRQTGEAAAGHYEITLAAGAWNASAKAPGFPPAEPASIDIQDGQTATHDFILTRNVPPPIAGAQGIRGTVHVRDQKSADNALPPVKITITPVDASAASAEPSADNQGSYSQDLRPATYQVVAEAPGYVTARSGPKAVFATKYTIVDLTLVRSPAPAPVTFEGVVYEQTGEDENTKHSLPGATVEVRRQGAAANPVQEQSDGEGRVQMTIPGGLGDYQATARMSGFRPQSVRLLVRDPSEHHAAEFVLIKTKSLAFEGTVYEQTGNDAATKHPLAGATVSLRQGGMTGAPGTTGSDGKARLLVLPGDYQAEASMSGLGSQTLDASVRDGGPNRAEFVLRRAQGSPSFEGRVLGQTGEDTATRRPLQGATILIAKRPRAAADTQGTTGPDGAAQVDISGGQGNYQVTASMEGYGPQSVDLVVRGDEHHAAEFVLKKLSAPLAFQGTVFVQRGDDAATRRPLPQATVQLSPLAGAGDATPVQGTTDQQGRAGLSVLTGPGRYQATASKPNLGSQTLRVVIRPSGENGAEFVLKLPLPPSRQPTFQGIVYLQQGQEPRRRLPGATVRIWKADWSAQGQTDQQGAVRMTKLSGPGGYQAQAEMKDCQSPGPVDVVIHPSGETRQEFVLILRKPTPRQPSFAATVVGKTGDDVSAEAPLAGATVWISKPDGTGKLRRSTSPDGQARLDLPAGPGEYVAGAELRGYDPVRADVTIGPDGETTHTFVLQRRVQPHAALLATVVGATGDDVSAEAPLAGATVWISKPDGTGKLRRATGPDGQARLDLPAGPGQYLAGAELRGYRPVRANVTIGPDGATTHKFIMRKAGLVLDVVVIDEKKQPLLGANVELRRQGTSAGLTQGRTGAGGRVRLNIAAGAGDYELSAQLNGYKPGRRAVTVSESGQNSSTIVLQKSSPVQPKLTVIVNGQNAGGATTLLSGASVQISQNNRPLKTGRTDNRGRFVVDLAPGDYQVRVSSPGYAPANFARVTVGPDGREEKIVLHANIQ